MQGHNAHIHFFDAANSHNVPSGVYAAVPVDGRFAWSPAEVRRMHKVIRYTVLGGADAAHRARGIDIEFGDRANDPDFYVPFLRERLLHYGDATPYVNRSNRPTVESHCREAGVDTHKFLWWESTLDGTIMQDVWATQFQGGIRAGFDLSLLQGVDNFHRP